MSKILCDYADVPPINFTSNTGEPRYVHECPFVTLQRFFFLFLRFSLSLPLSNLHSFSPSIHDSSPVLAFNDQVRQRHLYVENKHNSLFVEILPNGTVSVTQGQTPYTLLELKAVKPGYTAIRGVMSSLYLCMNGAGHLFTLSVFLDADCSFSEMLQPDGYTHFLSAHHRLPVSLSLKGSPGKHTLTFSQFLPLRTHLSMEIQGYEEPSIFLTTADFDSDDPLRLTNTQQDLRSPMFHINQ
ncbi:fibroblast growth factor 19-like [Hemibagrus wyckioides]|uniref:fibroblast growth factor 19-like n=1 Tax=Hemibagrus wyckioides TaxID=337641 RepID=UPI00266C571B|nr:fibroblast growth factor 19-like [Hemibagrus wyckioides]